MNEVPGFAFADLERRTFLVLNRAGDGYHYIHPVDAQDRRVIDGLVTPGLLVCECAGGRYRGSCYQTSRAEQALRAAGKGAAADWIAPAAPVLPPADLSLMDTIGEGANPDAPVVIKPAPRGDDFEVMP